MIRRREERKALIIILIIFIVGIFIFAFAYCTAFAGEYLLSIILFMLAIIDLSIIFGVLVREIEKRKE